MSLDTDLLLDTHVLIWAQMSPDNLGKKCRSLLLNSSNRLHVSPISSLEIGRLVWGGRLKLGLQVEEWFGRACRHLDLQTIPLSHEVAWGSYFLPEPLHRDPADRLLISTARFHGFTLVTADQRIIDYHHVMSLDARD